MTSRTRALVTSFALAAALATTLTACGGDDEAATATDTAPTTATAEPTPTAPTVEPEPGSLPDFPYTDYAYTLEMRCFCANVDQKYRIEVAGGVVSGVTWATDGEGHQTGDAVADDYLEVTIQDLIDKGNDPKAAQVDVEWPAGQLWPTSIYVDGDKMIADDEVTWVISDVEPA